MEAPQPDPAAPAALDDAALERWIDEFRGPLIGLVASWTRDWGEAHEVAADTFAEAWVGRARFEGDPEDVGAAGAWLRGIAFRLHSARSRTRGRLRLVGGDPRPAGLEPAAPDPAVSDPRMEAMRAAFATLKGLHQTVLRMHYLEQSSTRKVAALLGRTEKSVEHLLRRARRALQEETNRELARRGEGVTP
ncbi:MAG: sigma-70 family RNA polymerase sigma factor [Planctomycetota bacterium]